MQNGNIDITYMNKRASFTEIVLILFVIAFIFFFPYSGWVPFPFGYTIPVLILVWFFLKRTKENFSTLGFSFKRFEIKSIFIGAVAAIFLFVFLQYLLFPLLSNLIPLKAANLDDFKQVRHHLPAYLFITVMGWLGGGFYEELVFHGFIFTRFEKLFTGKYLFAASFLLTNIIFALYHFQLGASGMLNAFFAGCAYHALMIKYNRNLWYSFFFHGFFDTIALTYIYLGYW